MKTTTRGRPGVLNVRGWPARPAASTADDRIRAVTGCPTRERVATAATRAATEERSRRMVATFLKDDFPLECEPDACERVRSGQPTAGSTPASASDSGARAGVRPIWRTMA